jgi:hypothetical protein
MALRALAIAAMGLWTGNNTKKDTIVVARQV